MGVDEIFGPVTANIDLNHHICSQKVRSSIFENAKSNYLIFDIIFLVIFPISIAVKLSK